jgi:thiosulfate dehydrogenase [quinone] large subunit
LFNRPFTVSTNPLDIFLGVIILAAGFNAGQIGLDRWVIPYIHKLTNKEGNIDHPVKHSA